MGWLFSEGWNRASLIQHLTEPKQEASGWSIKTEARCTVGNVLWAVQTVTGGSRDEGAPTTFIACYLLQGRGGQGWGYKDMDEDMGPSYYSCPLKYLTLQPVIRSEWGREWREKVHAYHAAADRLRKLKPGAPVRLKGMGTEALNGMIVPVHSVGRTKLLVSMPWGAPKFEGCRLRVRADNIEAV